MKTFKYLPVIFFLLIISVKISAATIKGYITDHDTGEPVVAANIFIVGTNNYGSSNLKGFYIIKDVPVGKFKLKVLANFYKSQIDSIQIKKPDEIVILDIKIKLDAVYLDSVTTPAIEAYHRKLQELNKIKPVMSIKIDSLKYSNYSLRAFLSMTNNTNDSIYIFRNYDCFTVIKPTMKDSTGKVIRETAFSIDCTDEKRCPDSGDLILIKPQKTIQYSTILEHYNFRRIPVGRYTIKIGYEFKLPKLFLRVFCSNRTVAKTYLKGLRGTYISSNEVTFVNK